MRADRLNCLVGGRHAQVSSDGLDDLLERVTCSDELVDALSSSHILIQAA